MVMDKEVSRSSAGSKRCHDDGAPTTTMGGNNDITPMKKKFRTEEDDENEPVGPDATMVTPESSKDKKEWEGRVQHSPRKCRTVRVSVPEGVSIPEGITISVDSPMHSDSDEQHGGPPPVVHTLRIHKSDRPPPEKEMEADVEVEDRSVESLQLEVSGKRKTTMEEEEEANDGEDDEDEDDVPDDNSEGTARILRQIHQSNMERDVSASQQEHARRVRLKMQELLLSQQVATPIVVEEEETGSDEYVEESTTTTPEPSSAGGEHQPEEEEEVSMMEEELVIPAAKFVYTGAEQSDNESSPMMDMIHNGVASLLKLIIRLLCFMVMIALLIPIGMEIARLIAVLGETDDVDQQQPELETKRPIWEIFGSFRDIPETMIE